MALAGQVDQGVHVGDHFLVDLSVRNTVDVLDTVHDDRSVGRCRDAFQGLHGVDVVLQNFSRFVTMNHYHHEGLAGFRQLGCDQRTEH
ncbi:hypothetical protein D3C78_1764660 [compost metagenome]